MTVLITGGAGTLAGDFLDFWQINSVMEDLVLVDNFSQSSIQANQITYARASLIEANCGELEVMTDLFKKYQPRAILHFASTMDSSTSGFESNIRTLLVTLRAAESTSLPTIFFPQSFLTRDCKQLITDESLLQPEFGDYPLFKALCEQYLRTYAGKSIVGIISTTLSPRLSIGPIPAFTKRLLGDQPISISDTKRDYVSPSTVVDAVLRTLEDSFSQKTVVIASGEATSTKDIYGSVLAQLKMTREPEPAVTPPGVGDPKEILLAPSKSLIETGWDPLYDIEASLQKCVDSVKNSTSEVRQHHVK